MYYSLLFIYLIICMKMTTIESLEKWWNHELSIEENADIINWLLLGEEHNWFPNKWVEDFNFLWSQVRDLNWWYIKNWEVDYLYLDRDDWWHVTLQRCYNSCDEDYRYWNVYIEKDASNKWFLGETQVLCHKFHWVRSLKHALYLGQIASELTLWLSHPEDFFITRKEWNEISERDLDY